MKKNALFLLLTAALLAGCNNDDKTVAAAPATDPTQVAPAPELLSQLKLADCKHSAGR
jgi:cobalt-zinc-cadmium efflux system membrane fusion protein